MPRLLLVAILVPDIEEPSVVRPTGMPADLVQLCPECGSGDIRWCNISVRPYCADCVTWGGTHFGTAADASQAWNRRLLRAGMIDKL